MMIIIVQGVGAFVLGLVAYWLIKSEWNFWNTGYLNARLSRIVVIIMGGFFVGLIIPFWGSEMSILMMFIWWELLILLSFIAEFITFLRIGEQ